MKIRGILVIFIDFGSITNENFCGFWYIVKPEQVHLSLPEHEDLDEKSVESLGFGGLLDELGIEATQSTSGNQDEGSERRSRGRGKLLKGKLSE